MEYILGGKNNDRENLKSVAAKLLLIRQGVNMAYLISDGGKRIQIETLSLAIASGFLVPAGSSCDRGGIDILLGICREYSGCERTFCRRPCTACKNCI